MAEATTRRWSRSIFGRALEDHGRSLVGWLIGLALFSLVMLAVYPTIHGNEQMSKLLDAYPEALRKLFAITDYTSGPGYLRAEVFSFFVPLLVSLFAILWGADLIAGEEDRRTIDILLSNPVSRRRVVVEKWLALVAGTLVLGASVLLVLGLLGPAFDLHVGWVPLSSEVLGTTLMAIAFGSVALFVGSATGSRAAGLGAGAAVTVASYLLSSLPALVGWLTPVRPLSLWWQAIGVDPLTNGFLWWRQGIVALAACTFAGLAAAAFSKRDLAT